MADLIFTPQQLCAIQNRGGALLVSAAAGSGKTRVLVERLLHRMTGGPEPVDVDRFLIITYTRAAAAELRGRIMEELGSRLAVDPHNRFLRRQAELIRHAHISTIHSFCTDILREFAHLLDLQPGFRVAEESESDILRSRVLEEVLETRYDGIGDDPAFALLVDTLAAGRDDSKLADLVLEAHTKLQSHPYPDKWIERQIGALDLSDCEDAGKTVWGELLMEKARQTASHWLELMRGLLTEGDEAFDAAYGPSVEATAESIYRFIRALDLGWDSAKAAAAFDFPRPKNLKGHEAEKKLRSDCKDALGKLTGTFETSSEELIADMEAMRPAVTALLRLVTEFDAAYEKEKRRRGVIDFHDQEHLAVRLLWDPENDRPTEAAERIAAGFEEIMIDEYQDVNEVQEMIFGAVSRSGSNVFMVGDVKQSIYRFRLADPGIFRRKYRSFKDVDAAAEGEPRKVILPENFRSRPGVLDAVNFVFRNVMSEEFGGMDYTERESLKPGRNVPEPGFAPVELCIVSADTEEDGEEEMDRTDADAAFIAARIGELMAFGMEIPDKGAMRPLRYSDIAVLLHSAKNRAWKYAYELAARGIPCTAPTGEGFFDAPEIAVMTSLIAVIDNPLQDIPLISALRSPLIGLKDDELGKIRIKAPGASFYEALCVRAEEDEKCRDFLELLGKLREAAPEMSSDRLIWRIYSETGAMAVFGAMRGGEKKRANLMRFYRLAAEFEANGYRGLFAFNAMLRRMMELGQEPAAQDEGSAGDCVQIMTIHKSKGLEFPVVILADMDGWFNLSDSTKPVLFHTELGVGSRCIDTSRRIAYPTLARLAIADKITDEALFEELRVLYVAMTRAREKLILSMAMKNPAQKLMKLAASSRIPVPPLTLRSAKSFADIVLLAALSRPECRFLFDDSAAPAKGEADGIWDVRLIAGPVAPPETKPGEEAAREAEPQPEPEITDVPYPRPMAAALPSKLTATELKGSFRFRESMEEAEITEAAAGAGRPFDRPRFITGEAPLTGAEKGTALHLAMQYIDLEKCTDPDSVAAELARLRSRGFLTEKQAAAVNPSRILAFLSSETGRRALNAEKLRRELKFSLLVCAEELYPGAGDDEILFQGVVDLCIEEAGEITVIDFKTDYVTPDTVADRAARYTPQIRSYGMALSRMTGKPVKDRILYFLTLDKAVRV